MPRLFHLFYPTSSLQTKTREKRKLTTISTNNSSQVWGVGQLFLGRQEHKKKIGKGLGDAAVPMTPPRHGISGFVFSPSGHGEISDWKLAGGLEATGVACTSMYLARRNRDGEGREGPQTRLGHHGSLTRLARPGDGSQRTERRDSQRPPPLGEWREKYGILCTGYY